MKRSIQFLGLGIESGQENTGLLKSHNYIRQYFEILNSMGLKIIDHGEVNSLPTKKSKIHSEEQLIKIDWQPYIQAYSKIESLLKNSSALVNWGGDHSVGISTVGAFTSLHPDGCVLWIDAHTDLNLPQHSKSGNFHGMPLSILLNLEQIRTRHFAWIKNSLKPENLIYLGVRDIDPYELEIIQKLKIRVITIEEFRSAGAQEIVKNILQTVSGRPMHISFDIDGVCPETAPSTGLRVPGGLIQKDLIELGNQLSFYSKITSLDIVEINPELGSKEQVLNTYIAAISFLMALF